MKVRLMLTCLCDAYFGEVGIATVRVLEHAGCEVIFEKDQTCCGQPPFNSGDWDESRKIALHCEKALLSDSIPVVSPSGSCTSMIREGYPALLGREPHGRVYELAEFLVHQLNLTEWKTTKTYPKKVAFHPACHGRMIGLKAEAKILLATIPGLELIPFEDESQCCGFGGSFCVTQPKLSGEIGLEKLRRIQESGAEEIVSGDMGCLMHLQGLISKNNLNLKTRHFAEILAEVIP